MKTGETHTQTHTFCDKQPSKQIKAISALTQGCYGDPKSHRVLWCGAHFSLTAYLLSK